MIGERLLRVAHHAFIILVVLASTIVLSAQTVVDPQYVEFTASPDHDAVANGTPLVQRYSLSIFAVGSSVAFDTVDLGKPAPSAGVIRVNFIPLLHSQPTPNVVYRSAGDGRGPGGSTASSVSNGFSFQATAPPCAPTINSTGQSVGSAATTGSVGVTAGTGCAWTAASNAGWVTLTGATSGTGNGSVPYSIAANTTTSARTGDTDGRGQALYDHSGGVVVHVRDRANERLGAGGRRHGFDGRHVAGRVCVDGREQQHLVVDGDGWRERQRQRHGRRSAPPLTAAPVRARAR